MNYDQSKNLFVWFFSLDVRVVAIAINNKSAFETEHSSVEQFGAIAIRDASIILEFWRSNRAQLSLAIFDVVYICYVFPALYLFIS